MLSKIRALKEKKGFTLVELIVVLVILAILAALLIPALTGYIDKARKESIVAETRQVVMAAQTEISEAYGQGVKSVSWSAKNTATDPTLSEIAKLAELSKDNIKTIEYDAAGKVTKVEYQNNGWKCVYENSAYTCTKA